MKGVIIEAIAEPGTTNPHDYRIKGEGDEIYFAHMGDLTQNENILYNTGNSIEVLPVGCTVEFEPVQPKLRAIHVRREN